MEKKPFWNSIPADSAEGATLLIFSASLVCTCVALFGERLPALCIGIAVGCTLVLAVVLRVQRSTNTANGFMLDDDARSINPHGGRPIPFDAVIALRLILYHDRACLHVTTGMLRRRKCLACVPRNGTDQDIVRELQERSFTVKVSKNPFKKRTAEILPLIIMPLLAGALLYVNVDLYRKVPCLAQPPREFSVEPSSGRTHNKLYRLDPFLLSLPRNYRLINRQEQTMVFYNLGNDTRLAVSTGLPRETVPDRPFLESVAGLLGYGNDYEAAVLAVRSRFGLMPSLIKSALLRRYDASTVQIYHVRAGALSGIMLRGEQKGHDEDTPGNMPDQVTEIMLRHAEKAPVIRMQSASRLPQDIERIRGLIAGIR
jgi:hypothetical protein